MKLRDLVERAALSPWSEEEKIPWNEPGFSARMLREHLTQAHDAASRRLEIVDRQVAWIHETPLGGRASSVLDLGCGPGLYTSRLARRGHTCTGIDFSPASIAHAREEAEREGLTCTYHERDLRDGGFGEGFALAMLLFGELNAFRESDVKKILAAARRALPPGDALLLEVHTFESLERDGDRPASWYTAHEGLFADTPHLCLKESAWDVSRRARIERYYVVDAGSGEVSRYGITSQAYGEDEYRGLLSEAGFTSVERHAALGTSEPQKDLFVWVAR